MVTRTAIWSEPGEVVDLLLLPRVRMETEISQDYKVPNIIGWHWSDRTAGTGPWVIILVTGPSAAKIPNPEVQSIGRDNEMDLPCHRGSRSGKSVYLVVGYP